MRILVIAHAISSWGGVQEWAYTLLQGLAAKGHQVGVISPTPNLIERARQLGAETLRSELTDDDIPECLEWFQRVEWDVIVTSPMRSREVGQFLSRETGVPFIATFHGVYTDYVYSWKSEARSIVAVTNLLSRMIGQIAGISSEEVAVIPNGVSEAQLRRPGLSFEEKIADGVFKIALASRLDIDKLKQLDELSRIVSSLADSGIDRVEATIMGDGSGRGYFNSYLQDLAARHPHFSYEISGWTDLPDMLTEIEASMISLAAGRTALHSLSVGTPVHAVGARESVGLFAAPNVQDIADSNFGDYFTPRDFKPITKLDRILDPDEYGELSTAGREFVRSDYTAESMVAKFEALIETII